LSIRKYTRCLRYDALEELETFRTSSKCPIHVRSGILGKLKYHLLAYPKREAFELDNIL